MHISYVMDNFIWKYVIELSLITIPCLKLLAINFLLYHPTHIWTEYTNFSCNINLLLCDLYEKKIEHEPKSILAKVKTDWKLQI